MNLFLLCPKLNLEQKQPGNIRIKVVEMVNIKDIAKLAGVSPATVSRVINEKSFVKAEVREKVLALVKETGKWVDGPIAHVFTVRGGKITRFLDFIDTAQTADAYSR